MYVLYVCMCICMYIMYACKYDSYLEFTSKYVCEECVTLCLLVYMYVCMYVLVCMYCIYVCIDLVKVEVACEDFIGALTG